jgi:hypothetical protein
MAAFLAPMLAASQLAIPVAAPDVKVGDRWKFRLVDPFTGVAQEGNQQLIADVQPDGFVVEETAPGAEPRLLPFDREWNGFQEVKGRVEHQVRVRFPLEPGKSWSSRYEWVNARSRHGQYDMTYRVGSPERITVPAGTFDVLRIEGSGTWRNFTTGASGIIQETRWYAPSARNMVRRTVTSRYAGGARDQDQVIELQEMQLRP